MAESTCQKRQTVCEIYDLDWNILSRESNRCSPDGTCHRLGLVQVKAGYDVVSLCNWTHAEMMAINALPERVRPYRAVLHGHNFFCDACEQALRSVGVRVLYVSVPDFEKRQYLRTADGECICTDCNRQYRKHPYAYPQDWLRVLCNGTLAHL